MAKFSDKPGYSAIETAISGVVQGLYKRRQAALDEVKSIEKEIAGVRRVVLKAVSGVGKQKRVISEAGRKAMAKAAKARWARKEKVK